MAFVFPVSSIIPISSGLYENTKKNTIKFEKEVWLLFFFWGFPHIFSGEVFDRLQERCGEFAPRTYINNTISKKVIKVLKNGSTDYWGVVTCTKAPLNGF